MNRHRFLMGPLRDPEGEEEKGGGGGGGAPTAHSTDFEDTKKLMEEMRELRDQVKATQQTSQTSPSPPAAPPPTGRPLTREEMEQQYWKDPLSSTAAIAQHAANSIARQFQEGLGPSMQALEEIAKQEARKIDSATFDKYLPQIEAKMSLAPKQFRSNPQTWKNAFNAVRGENFEEISKGRQAAPPGTTDGPGMSAPRRTHSTTPGSSLTEEELAIAKKLKISAKDYEHGKQLVNDQGNAWNSVFTFESGQSGVRAAN